MSKSQAVIDGLRNALERLHGDPPAHLREAILEAVEHIEALEAQRFKVTVEDDDGCDVVELPGRPDTVYGRTNVVAALITRGQWGQRVISQVAKEWQLNETTIRSYEQRAKSLLATIVDPENVRHRLSMSLSNVLEFAEQDKDAGSVARVADVWGKLVGAHAAHKVEVDLSTPEFRRVIALVAETTSSCEACGPSLRREFQLLAGRVDEVVAGDES